MGDATDQQYEALNEALVAQGYVPVPQASTGLEIAAWVVVGLVIVAGIWVLKQVV